jgi:hypothetical protein
MVSAGKTWQVLAQPYPDLIIVKDGAENGFVYDESSRSYLGNVLFGNTLSGSFSVTALTDTDIRLAHSSGVTYQGSITDAIHIKGVSPGSWDGYEQIDITKYMSPIDRAVYYAYVNVYSPSAQSARLLIRSDDDCKAWLNHTKVYGTDTISGFMGRGVARGLDKTNITLSAGWNSLLIKVVNSGGPTGFAVCIAGTDDAPLTNLVYSTDTINTSTTVDQMNPTYTSAQDAALIAYLSSQPGSTLNSSWTPGMTASEYLATLSPEDRAVALQAMYAGNTSLPPAPQSETLAKTTDALVSKGWGVTAQMVFYAAIGIVVILLAIFLL